MELQELDVIGIKRGRLGQMKPETRKGYILLCALLWSAITFLLLQRFVLTPVVVEGQSMTPALKPGDGRLVNCWLPLFRSYHRADTLVIRDRKQKEPRANRIV